MPDRSLLEWANFVAVVAAGAYVFVWQLDGFYEWLSQEDILFAVTVLALAGSVPLALWLRRDGRRCRRTG
jgi:hypothetical protein